MDFYSLATFLKLYALCWWDVNLGEREILVSHVAAHKFHDCPDLLLRDQRQKRMVLYNNYCLIF